MESNKKGFATLVVLMIFMIMSVIILIVMQKQHFTLYTAQFFDNKSVSRAVAETVARQIVKETYTRTTEENLVKQIPYTITVYGYKTDGSAAASYTINTPKAVGKDNCNTTVINAVNSASNINFIIPAHGFCMIEDNPKHVYSLIVDGCNDSSCTVKSRVSVGFSID